MTIRRGKCVIKGLPHQKVIPHGKFIDRIRKSLYFGGETLEDEMEISRPLADYASELFSEPHKGHSLNRLNKVTAGSVHATPCSLIMALIYLDRLNATDPAYVRRITPSELFIVSMVISTKFYSGHDEECYLSDWAEDGNMEKNRLKQLELEFLSSIEWNIYISNEQFFDKLTSIEKTLAEREGLRRGWLTYTELVQMLPSFTLAKFFITNITVMAVSYVASVMTIAGAFFLASQIPGNALHRIRRTPGTPGDDVKNQVREACSNGCGAGSSDGSDVISILNANNDDRLTSNNRSNSSLPTSSSSSSSSSSSTTAIAPAFNAEEELLKLEQQFRNEEYLDGKRMHKNKNEQIYYLNTNELNSRFTNTYTDDTYIHWHNYKDEYSDDLWNKISLTNYTKTILWNLLSDAENTIARLPFVWRKFI